MEENPYKAPVERGSTATTPKPIPSLFWLVSLVGSVLWWFGMNAVLILLATGLFDPRRDDNLPPDKFGMWCMFIAAEWIVSAALSVLAIIKLRRAA